MTRGFTLIELLVVIAIIAILAVVVVLTLSPSQLIFQSRDANRLSDLATMASALNYYVTDSGINGGENLGLGSTTYVSIPDPTATSSAGDQCQGLGLPALSSGYSYHCAASSTFRLVNGTGWIPVNFSGITQGSPLGQLPVDPINQTSSNLFYTYQTNGSQFEVTAIPESQKQKTALAQTPMVPLYPDVMAEGSNLTLSGLWNPSGLVGYWPLTEGSGTIAYDLSGNGNTGSWSGTMAGTNGYYSGGKVGSYAGYFDGSTNYVNFTTSTLNTNIGSGNFTVVGWINTSGLGDFIQGTNGNAGTFTSGLGLIVTAFTCTSGKAYFQFAAGGTRENNLCSAATVNNGAWHQIAVVVQRSNTQTMFVDGILSASASTTVTGSVVFPKFTFGYSNWQGYFNGSFDDARIYNRALSTAEVQALYNAEH